MLLQRLSCFTLKNSIPGKRTDLTTARQDHKAGAPGASFSNLLSAHIFVTNAGKNEERSGSLAAMLSGAPASGSPSARPALRRGALVRGREPSGGSAGSVEGNSTRESLLDLAGDGTGAADVRGLLAKETLTCSSRTGPRCRPPKRTQRRRGRKATRATTTARRSRESADMFIMPTRESQSARALGLTRFNFYVFSHRRLKVEATTAALRRARSDRAWPASGAQSAA